MNSYVNTTIKTDRNTETLQIDIILGGKKFVVGIIYRPPDLDEEASAPLMQELARASRYNNVCIMGTINHRKIDWDSMTGDERIRGILKCRPGCFFHTTCKGTNETRSYFRFGLHK